MHNELVDKRHWIDEEAFLRALHFCMLLPGPEAMQLATWLGWRLHGLRGGIAAGRRAVRPACRAADGIAELGVPVLLKNTPMVGFAGGWQHPDLSSALASGLLGAAVSVWATFLPSFLFVLTAAPWIEHIGRWPRANAMLATVTAAVVGVIAHLALWFGRRLLAAQDWRAAVLAVLIAMLVYVGLSRWRWSVAAVVPAAGLVGAIAQAWVAIAA